MIPAPALLRRDALDAWKMSYDENEFRRTFVESWAQRINTAFKAGELDGEESRLAFMAVLSPIPSRRRFDRHERMSESAAIVALFQMGVPCRSSEQVAHHAMPDLPYVRDIAAEYGITIIDFDELDQQENDIEPDDEEVS